MIRILSKYVAFAVVAILLSNANGFAGTVVLQPGPAKGKDVWITSVYSYNDDYGVNDAKLQVGGWGDYYFTLIRFDLTTAPQQASSAVLVLQPYSRGDTSTPVSMNLRRITSAWDENTGWYTRPTSVFVRDLSAPIVGSPYSIDVTDLYNAWKSGQTPNFGIELTPTSIANRFNVFRSSDYATASARPKLVVSTTGGTTGAPSKPSNLRAKISSGSVSLSWKDRSTNESRFELQCRPSPGTFSTIAYPAPNATSEFDNISTGAVRVYRIRAQNNDGSSSWSNICWVNANPARPNDLAVVQRSETTVTLSWKDRSSNEYAFLVQRRNIGSSAWATVGKVAADVEQIQDLQVAANASYEYRVRAQGKPSICIKNSRWSTIVRSDPVVTPNDAKLTINKGGVGSGTVSSSPSGISCGGQCSANFSKGAFVTLTATPGATSRFSGWSGACAGVSPTCYVTMSSNKTATATFSSSSTGCPTASPLTDLTKNCSSRTYLYGYPGSGLYSGPRVELVTDGSKVEVVLYYLWNSTEEMIHIYGTVTSPTTFKETKWCGPPNASVCFNVNEAGSLSSAGYNLTVYHGTDATYPFVGSQ